MAESSGQKMGTASRHGTQPNNPSEELMKYIQTQIDDQKRRANVRDTSFPSGELPQDIRELRVKRADEMNEELARMFRTQVPSQPTAVSLQGMGTYTHVKPVLWASTHPNQQFIRTQPAFLPLGGPERRNASVLSAPEVPQPVKELYAKLKTVLVEEEKIDDITRFEPLPVPNASATNTDAQGDVEMADASRYQGDHEPRRASIDVRQRTTGDSAPAAPQSEARRPSTGGDVAMDGINPPPAVATMYDANRDPRVRARRA